MVGESRLAGEFGDCGVEHVGEARDHVAFPS
jgi:hypothetical protein